MSAEVIVVSVETHYAVTGAPIVTTSAGERFTPDQLHVSVYPDGSLDVSAFGTKISEFWPTEARTSKTWLHGPRFAGGIAKGLPDLATAPEWMQAVARTPPQERQAEVSTLDRLWGNSAQFCGVQPICSALDESGARLCGQPDGCKRRKACR